MARPGIILVVGLTRFVMIRHAESASLAGRWISGQASCRGITERGRQQATALHSRLLAAPDLRPNKVISSSMRRAAETTAIITNGIIGSYELSDEVVERRPGECEGMTYDQYEATYGRPPWSDWRNPLSLGGESDTEFVSRIRNAIARLIACYEGQTLWIICHGGVLMATAHFLMPSPRDATRWDNPMPTSISEWHRPVTPDSHREWTLHRYNDYGHLATLPTVRLAPLFEEWGAGTMDRPLNHKPSAIARSPRRGKTGGVDVEPWVSALGRYAERLHEGAGPGHHVVSALGAWMLVALCAPLADDEQSQAELADALGVEPMAAAVFAAGLLSDPHPLVAAGAGLWVRPFLETIRFKQWRGGLPGVVDTGDIPTQRQLDRWAAERTGGLIERFPIERDPRDVCLLATALATKVSWEVPFKVVDSIALAPSPWSSQLHRVLRSPAGDPRHRQYLADTDRAGRVGVHLTGARGGLLVGSVIAADQTVASGDVLAAAEAIVTAEARQPGSVARLSLFDLPIGEEAVWSISEEAAHTTAPDGQQEQVISVLPAWWAETDLDLHGDESLGFPGAARLIAAALQLREWYYEARQTAVARYSALGFEAAAVTALAVRTSAVVSLRHRRRVATIRFAHPFAVVAAACDDTRTRPADPIPPAWQGLPVFSAWVAEPTDADG